MNELAHLKKRVEALEARNKRVELDKAWEGSLARSATDVAGSLLDMGTERNS
jgi:BMFP domain-containing protein YqiC